MKIYYNENDPFAVAWLRQLMEEGCILYGEIDDRSIREVAYSDLEGFDQCHFFAGIGGWAYALELAGWGERRVWTGSCPCQPFSQAGQGKGFEDERHLWPEFYRLIGECQPATVFGEQVAGKDGRIWLSRVRSDLEKLDYAVGAADLCAAGVAAPHIRQRLYWVGHTNEEGLQERERNERVQREALESFEGKTVERGSDIVGLADSNKVRCNGSRARNARGDELTNGGGLEHASEHGREQRRTKSGERSPVGGCWQNGVWLECTDGKSRRIEPESFPLAHGVPNRVGKLRGYGNAIVPALAAEFVRSFLDIEDVLR